jgi:hypothetical protein
MAKRKQKSDDWPLCDLLPDLSAVLPDLGTILPDLSELFEGLDKLAFNIPEVKL